MTIEQFQNIIKENNIPLDAKLQSDSGWECGPTEMNVRGFAFIQNYNYDYNEIGELFYFTNNNILNVGFIKTDEKKLPVFSRYIVNMSKK